ncbi:helix-turn-helix domain-containing protein [Geomonas subterranea]|uniref:helix-turn-helix domain-containing protein n=1 Tax=Geomonas subterranea TaxID=2847989 RepID=UPI001CD24219|nr:helix-turn-helix domain-containing protein [Geomonas fuzhouensis]
MPTKLSIISIGAAEHLIALGQQIRAHRKALRISATTAAEAAGMSRVTLHRIEKGEPAVTMGAYMNAMAALGLNLGPVTSAEPIKVHSTEQREGWIPARIPLAEYPQLKQLAWQVQGTETLSPKEAWDIYQHNWRHLDEQSLTENEDQLIAALRMAFGGN